VRGWPAGAMPGLPRRAVPPPRCYRRADVRARRRGLRRLPGTSGRLEAFETVMERPRMMTRARAA
jgi:hypothetical protein